MFTLNPSKIRAAMKKMEMTEYALSRHLARWTGRQTTQSVVQKWLTGLSEPNLAYSMALMKIFNFTKPEDFCDVDIP